MHWGRTRYSLEAAERLRQVLVEFDDLQKGVMKSQEALTYWEDVIEFEKAA